MKKITFAILLLSTSLCLAGGPVPHNPADDVAAIKQIGKDMGDAMVAVDLKKLDEIFADDWATVSRSGKLITKETMFKDFEAFHDRLLSYELGPIEVQVLGNLAVAHGTVSEKRIRNGKDISGEGVYMDFLEKRNGKWVVVRSAGKLIPYEK